ncbi:MAG: PspC domain-containing protein [Porphyromonas sp.]|nr:PspC domain-containing protein [Porphyromonas sp.]
MEKVLSVDLAGQVYHIAQDAYGDLDRFLEKKRAEVRDQEAYGQLVSDLADLLSSALSKKGRMVIDQETAREAIECIRLSRNSSADERETGGLELPVVKKYYRDPDRALLCGVLSGLSIYKGWNLTALRILIVLFTVGFSLLLGLGWAAPVAYIWVWLAVPSAVTTSQKMELRGLRATEANYSAVLSNTASHPPYEPAPLKVLGCVLKLGVIAAIVIASTSLLLALVGFIFGVVNRLFVASTFLPFAYSLGKIPLWMPIVAVVSGVFAILLPLVGLRKGESRFSWFLLLVWIACLAVSLLVCLQMMFLLIETFNLFG